MTAINQLTASEAARRIVAGKLSAEEYVAAHLERIRQRNGDVQAWVHCNPETALAQARMVDQTKPQSPLAGVPVGFKDVIDTAGMPTGYNSPIYRDYVPQVDAACVAMVRHAGGIVLGKTVTTEFASRTPGPTRNPLNLAHSPGGSSSGSAAAVADFMVPLAFGTQTGGSVIRPAAFCGIVGYKPSFGTINRAGLKQLAESLDTIGVMARSVEDCALLTHVVSARRLPDFSTALAQTPRVGLLRTSRWSDASPAAQVALDAAAAAIAKKGARVTDVSMPAEFDRLHEDQMVIMNFEAARALAHERFTHPELLSEYLRNKLEDYWHKPREAYTAVMRHALDCRRMYADLVADFDVLLTLSAPGEAPQGITGTGSSLFNRVWTLLGAPCVTIPAGNGPQGLPLGVQIIGAYDDDERVLRIAKWIRQALG
jgi:amidase